MTRIWFVLRVGSAIGARAPDKTIFSKSADPFLRVDLWLPVDCHFVKARHGCCLASILKSLNMVVVWLTFLKLKKKSRHCCCYAGI